MSRLRDWPSAQWRQMTREATPVRPITTLDQDEDRSSPSPSTVSHFAFPDSMRPDRNSLLMPPAPGPAVPQSSTTPDPILRSFAPISPSLPLSLHSRPSLNILNRPIHPRSFLSSLFPPLPLHPYPFSSQSSPLSYVLALLSPFLPLALAPPPFPMPRLHS